MSEFNIMMQQLVMTVMLVVFLCGGSVSGQLVVPSPLNGSIGSTRKELVPAMFVFGDSLTDNGNNNDLATFAKANYLPYGIDFKDGPTGRFCNGKTIVDQLAGLLGLPLIPPFSEATGDQMLHGVNYASAAAGILDDTGSNFMGRIPLTQQIEHFRITLDQITSNLGAINAADSIAKCIFFSAIGSNDYLNNYLQPNFPTRNQYNGQQYADLLVQKYGLHLTRLYNLGARKFVVVGVSQLGCIPTMLARSPTGLCDEDVNQLVVPFNLNIKTMIKVLNDVLPGSKFTYLDTQVMFNDLMANSKAYGLEVTDKGCCGIGQNKGKFTCLPLQIPCPDREHYLFWDAFHPTEKVNVLLGQKAFYGDTSFIHPMNVEQLARA